MLSYNRIEDGFMRLILDFFEYTISGWVYLIWFVLMIIFSLACLGVVGDKVSKQKKAELAEIRKKTAQDEYNKAQEIIDKQSHKAGFEAFNSSSKDKKVGTDNEKKEVPNMIDFDKMTDTSKNKINDTNADVNK